MGFTKKANLQLLKATKKKKKKKSKKSKNGGSGGGCEGEIITDSRFSSLHSDPRFQKVRKQRSKVAIDSRFDRMFSDKRFATSSAPLDKRGAPRKSTSENPLLHYYKLERPKLGEERESGEEEEEREGEEAKEEGTSSDEEVEGGEAKKRLEIPHSSDSESSDESELSQSEAEIESDVDTDTDLDEGYDLPEEDETTLQEENVPEIEKETHRLAVVNMDWDHVKAVNLYVLLSSCLPKGGRILSVAVYPSEFGLKCIEEEALHGPIGLFDDNNQDDSGDNELDNEKLREYEKSRLRYYYAVVECDSVATADYLYKSCNGVEYERSANVLDLRFIPDSMEFKHTPRDVAMEAPTSYESMDFHTPALQLSKVHCSWDEDEPHRARTLKRKFKADQIAEMELKEYLASDESDTDNDVNDGVEPKDSAEDSDKRNQKLDMYRALVQSNNNDPDEDPEDDNQDMEVTFNTDLEDISKRILEKKDRKSETVWEAYLRKRSEKRKARKNKYKSSSEESSDSDEEAHEEPDDFFVEEPATKICKKKAQGKTKKQQQGTDKEAEASTAELELLLADDKGTDNSLKGFNLKPKKAKGKKQKALNEDKIPTIDYNDPRFLPLFNSPLFALDPTDPQFKRSAAYARQLAQKQQKSNQKDLVEQIELPRHDELPPEDRNPEKDEHLQFDVSKREKHELSSLIRSVKMKSKSKQVQSPYNVLKEYKRNS